MRNISLSAAAFAAIVPMLAAIAGISPAHAQSSSSKWFVPKAADTPAPANNSGPRANRAPPAQEQAQASAAAPAGQIQVGLPPLPSLPQIARGSTPPAAVIGVLDVSGVLRSSAAYVAVQKEMAVRQDKLNSDAQQEQAVWREMNQTLTDQQKTISADQYAEKQKELQDRIAAKEKEFKARDQLNQDAANYAYEQIQQVLNSIVQQVAESRSMNLVLFQSQEVVLNAPEFDISQQVAAELNQVLPTVLVPPDGADVATFARAHEAKAGGK